jgi:2-hydroxy-4-carboxymuconate semialdehyde hemiacetal dehydrogenase
MTTIDICMVGTGRMGHTHTRNVAKIPGVVLHSVVGRTEEEAKIFAEEYGYQYAGTDLDTVLQAPEINAVIICTPNDLHGPQTESALRAGKHVLCELPVTLSLQKAEQIATLNCQKGLQVMVCHTERYEPGRLELWRRIQAGELHPLQVIADFHLYRPGACQTAENRVLWYDNALWHHGCHAVDAVISLLGETEALDFHATHSAPAAGSGFPLNWVLQWRTPRDILVSITLSHNAKWHKHEYRLICEEDTLVSSRWGMLSNKEGVLVDRRQGPSSSYLQDKEFITALRENRPPHPPGVDVHTALHTIRILQAAWDGRLKSNE